MGRGNMARSSADSREGAVRSALIGSFFGTALETYDFILFGTTAGLVFSKLFFPSDDPLNGILLAFGVFAVGFVARPFGGMIVANYGDKVGRKPMLLLTLGSMGIVTAAIGILPTYAQIGIAAPIILTLLRFVQGIAYGGEWGGAILVVIEHAPKGRRGFFGGFANGGSSLGTIFSGGVISLSLYATGDQFLSWGWRVPFLLGVAMVFVGFYVRTRILETPEFLALKGAGRARQLPIVDALRRHYREIVLTIGASTMTTATFYVMAIFMLSYGSRTLGMSMHTMLHGLMLQGVAVICSSICFGALSDRIGRIPVVMAGAGVMACYVFAFFWLVRSGDEALMMLGLVGYGLLSGMTHGPVAALYTEIYDASIRYSGATLGTQVGIVLGGGFSPMIATALLKQFDGATWPISLYIVALSIVGIACFAALGVSQKRVAYAAAA